MKTHTHDATRCSTKGLLAVAIATAALTSGSTALATGDRTILINGNSTVSDCGAAGFIQSFTCKELRDFDYYTERGREAFVGTWRGKQGRFTTKYTVDAAYGKRFCQSLDFTLQLSGSCIHKIDGRSGVFADAEGVFTLFDVITNVTGDPVTGAFTPGSGANNFLYFGRIRTSDKKSLGPAALEMALRRSHVLLRRIVSQ
jgi:hypothetical protein